MKKAVTGMKSVLLAFCVGATLTAAPASADIGEDMTDFWERAGGGANFTSASAYQGQRAGIISGGSAYIRVQPRNTPIANLQLPSFRAGCGGIDIHGGAFSYISADEMVATLQAIMASSAAYFFKAALHSLTPMLGEIAGQLEDAQAFMNSLNINSCETAQMIGQGAFDQLSAGATQACKILRSMNGSSADRVAAAKDCGSSGRTASTIRGNENDPVAEAVLVNTNVVWDALMDDAFLGLGANRELAELFMTLTGTVISQTPSNDTGTPQIAVYNPVAWDVETVDAFISGGDLEVYECNTESQDRCLLPTLTTTTISADDSFGRFVADALIEINDSLETDDALSADAISVINMSASPVLDAIKAARAIDSSMADAHINTIAEFVALDLALAYIDTGVTAVEALMSSNLSGMDVVEDFRARTRETKEAFITRRIAAQGDAANAFAALENLSNLRTFAGDIVEAGWNGTNGTAAR